MSAITISLIAAMSENRVIGRDNDMPWHISEDLKRFKRLTLGKPVIMGRKTFESLGKPLPDRTNIVISRSGFAAEGIISHSSLPDAIEAAKDIAAQDGQSELFIIGGGQIYTEAINQNAANRIYLTIVHDVIDGDVYFPVFDETQWREISAEPHDGTPAFTFKVFEKT